MRNPAPALQRLSHRPRVLRVFVSAGISFAQKLAAHGGCWAILKAAFEVIRREGLGGVRVRLLARVPEADLVVAHTPLHPKNILVLDHAIPMADMSAGDRATAGILKDLAGLGFDVTFLPANLSPAPHYQQQLESLGVRVITRDQGVSSLTQYLAGQGHDFGVFYLIRMDAAQSVLDLIRQVAPGAQLIFHAPDLHFLRESREAELSGDPAQAQAAQQTQARELALMRTVDHVIVVSPVEKDLLEIQAPDVPVSVFPALYADVADQVPGFDARQHIFFLGGFDHRPNQQAVLWFAQEIWPLVQARLPGVEFHILGARPTADIKALSSVPGVKVCGHISQLDATLAKLRLGVAPLQFGAGIKGKVATTLGAGIPCICTTIAAEGMHLRDGIDVLLADTAADFADAVVQAYTNQDIWQRLSSQGRLRIEHYFSQQANTCDLVTVLDAAHALPLDLYVQHCERLHSLPVPVADQSPVVSIIVVACNQWNLTRICLNAILMTCKNQDLPFEIILADDASIDETRDAAAHYIGLQVARTPFRMGYAGNCNHAAQLARGSLLIMISQEMVVLPGWLAPLVDVLDQHPDAVMAGAKALYLDGSIRNAGRHLFSDGTSIAAGRGLRRDTAVFNTIREIDTVDGGLKIVRRDFWQQACLSSRVGFSTYWQDVDLDQCAQAFGKTILYQPQAEAVCQDAEYYATLLARPVPVVPPEGPLVSIIIPVYNQWQVTRACINSVLETCSGDPVSYELILADDCSTDDTAHACEQYPGLIVSRTAHNVGFLRNCNQAAKLAQGQYILLLNNDTIVLPGWLDMLVQTLDHNPDVAIAGSKILYVDGKIQEAGAHLFTDATAMNAGRSQDRTAPLLNLPREVDYISGCSVLVRRSFWEQISGFDERYRTAYCEDSDLAMTARSLGFKVLYQPGSEIVHYEHQSYSHQKESSRKLQAHNIALLREKWHDVLLHDHLPASAMPYQVIAHSQRHPLQTTLTKRQNQGLDILYFSPFPSHPASHGNRSTINEFAHHFQRLGHRVHFVLLKYADQYTPEDAQAMREAWDTFDLIPFGRTMQIYPGGIPYDAWYEDGLGETIQTLCARYDIDMVFCSYVFQSKMLEYVPDYLLKVIDTHDKMGNRYEMLRQNGQPLEFFSCTPAEEGAYLRRADVVVARRKQEADYFDEQMGCQHSIVIPHVEPPRFIQRSFPVLRQVGVVASANRINLAIVLECLQAIDRHLGTQTPSFTLHIAGHVNEMIKDLPAADQLVFRRPWVVLHGFVDSIQDFYTSLDLVVSPVTMGTGINVKTVQAMAFGMPLLTTSWGAKGIETGHPMHEHADMDALAASLISLAQDPSDALQVLADTSRQRYQQFYEESMQGFNTLLAHPKLLPLDSHSNTQALS